MPCLVLHSKVFILQYKPEPPGEALTGRHSILPHAVKYAVEMQAIVSINMDIHQLCLYILGGAGSRQGKCIFHPRTFSCYWPSQLWFPQRRRSRFSSVAFKGVLLQHLWHLSKNVTSAVCTVLTAEHTRDFQSDDEGLQPGAEKWAWCFYSSAF